MKPRLAVAVLALVGLALITLSIWTGAIGESHASPLVRVIVVLLASSAGLAVWALAAAIVKATQSQVCFAGADLTIVWPGLFVTHRQTMELADVEGITVVTGYFMERQRELERQDGVKDLGLAPTVRGKSVFLGGYDAAL